MVQRMDLIADHKFRKATEYAEAFSSLSEDTVDESMGPLIDEYVAYVAVHGKTSVEWEKIKVALLWKLKNAIAFMRGKESPSSLSDADKDYLTEMTEGTCRKLFNFEAAPFTIQRLCELLSSPSKHYNSAAKFLRAVEKSVNIVTCVTIEGDRITGLSDKEMEEEEDESDIRVENSFIVSVDELDEPLTKKAKSDVDNGSSGDISEAEFGKSEKIVGPELPGHNSNDADDVTNDSKDVSASNADE